MKKLLMSIRCLVVLIMTGYAISGCTAVGSLVGLAIDTKDPKLFSMNDSIAINMGTQVEVISNQNDTIRGEYQGIINIQPLALQGSLENNQPTISNIIRDSNRVIITLNDSRKFEGNIFGFEPGIIRFRWVRDNLISPIDIPIDKIMFISSENEPPISGDTLRYWLSKGYIPSHSALIIIKDSLRIELPILTQRYIAKIKTETLFHTWTYGLIGLGIDVIATIKYLEEEKPTINPLTIFPLLVLYPIH